MLEIVVLVKRVPDTNARIVVESNRVNLSAVKWVISPYDEFAIETALRHKEAVGGRVIAVTLGSPDSDKILKDAKAIGVDDLVRVWDDSWGEMDSFSVQTALSQIIKDLNADVVYCGKSAADTGAGSTGPGIAEILGWCSVSNINDISFENGISVIAPVETLTARLSVEMPAVISCDKGQIKVRKPNVKGIMMAKRAQVQVSSTTIPTASVTLVSQSLPPEKPEGKRFEGGSSAGQVAQLLRDEANII